MMEWASKGFRRLDEDGIDEELLSMGGVRSALWVIRLACWEPSSCHCPPQHSSKILPLGTHVLVMVSMTSKTIELHSIRSLIISAQMKP